MWELYVHDGRIFSREVSRLLIPEDEIVFYAAICKGPTVHIGKETSVRLIHVAEYEPGLFITFKSSLLESTYLDARFPEFSEEGIMGKWLLHGVNGKPRLKFLQKIDAVQDFLEEAKSAENPQWIRRSYAIKELD
jgi:hypothetical protein